MLKKVSGSGGIRTHALERTGALNQRLRPLGHATLYNDFIGSSKILKKSHKKIESEPIRLVTKLFSVYGHIMLNAPVLVRSLKLSNIEPS